MDYDINNPASVYGRRRFTEEEVDLQKQVEVLTIDLHTEMLKVNPNRMLSKALASLEDSNMFFNKAIRVGGLAPHGLSPDWKVRLTREFTELKNKYEALKDFIETVPKFKELPLEDQELLHLQETAMLSYLGILERRGERAGLTL